MTEEQLTPEQKKAARRRALAIELARDVMIVVGVGLFSLGVYEIYVPAGHMTLGAVVAGMGLRGVLRG